MSIQIPKQSRNVIHEVLVGLLAFLIESTCVRCRQSRDGTIKVWDTEVLSNISQQPMPIRTLKTGFDHFCNASTCSTAGIPMWNIHCIFMERTVIIITCANDPRM